MISLVLNGAWLSVDVVTRDNILLLWLCIYSFTVLYTQWSCCHW